MKETAPVSDRPRLVYRKKPLMGDDAKHLRDTIRSELKNNGLVITLKAGAGKFTAHFIELGTEHMEPHPFINPSLRIATGRIEEQLAAAAGRIRGLS
jgi:HK97 gp10 family phage protein